MRKSNIAILAAAAVLSTGVASVSLAQEWTDPYALASSSNFEGLYLGVTGGAMLNSNSAYLAGADGSAPQVGAVAGVNFYLTESVVVGAEVQGSVSIGASGTTGDAFALGRVGYSSNDDMMIYGVAGPGVANGTSVYGVGVGTELSLTNELGVRGEILGVGTYGSGPDAIKANAGLIWHID